MSEQIARSEFVELVGSIVALDTHGADLRGPCPLHPDFYRSFYLLPHSPAFHCFGCGASGGPEKWSHIAAQLQARNGTGRTRTP